MSWLRNLGWSRAPTSDEDSGSAPDAGEDRGRGGHKADRPDQPIVPAALKAPGLAALFEELSRHGNHTVLDLGTATGETLQLYQPYALTIRFAGLHPRPPHGRQLERALDEIPPPEAGPYDTVLLWDVLDRLFPEERGPFMRRMVEITCPGARLYTIVDATGATTFQPVRIVPDGVGRIRPEPVGLPVPAGHPLLPAEVERVIRPFEVTKAITLRSGLREYLAARPR